MSKNVGDLGKLIVAKGFKSCPKSNKSPNLVTKNVLDNVIVISPVQMLPAAWTDRPCAWPTSCWFLPAAETPTSLRSPHRGPASGRRRTCSSVHAPPSRPSWPHSSRCLQASSGAWSGRRWRRRAPSGGCRLASLRRWRSCCCCCSFCSSSAAGSQSLISSWFRIWNIIII